MTNTRTVLSSAATLATILGMTLPAFAQAPAAPGAAPPPEAPLAAPPPPAEAVPPGPPSVMAPMMAPKSPSDMTGSLGFGVGVASNAELVGTTADVALKYWMQDTLAFVPQLNFNVQNVSGMGGGTIWNFAPQLEILYVPFQTTSTRLEIGGGLGFNVGKAVVGGSTAFALDIPIQAGVEHFFTRWFSMGIAVANTFFQYQHAGGGLPNTTAVTLNSTQLAGSLFFYTD